MLQFAQTNSINFTAGEQPIAIAIREQSQELYYLLHTFEYMIKKCTLNNSGNWDQGVSLHPRVWVFNPHDFRIAPDGSQAILYGGQDDSSHIFCVQYDETQFSGFVQPGDDEGVPEVIPPAAYGTDMRNVFFCGSDQKLYYISPIQLTFDNGFDFYSINGVAVTDIVVSADGNELYGIDPSSQFYIIDIKNNPAIASRHVIDLGNTKKLVSGQKGQVYFLSDKGIYGFYPRKDQSPVSLKEISFNVDNNTPFRFEVASNDTFLVCTDSNTLYVLLATASDPLQLYPNKPILLNNHPLDIAISPDNTRIFVLTGGSLEVFEAQFTMVGI